MIGIIDYGLGNIKAIRNIYHRLNIPSYFIKHEDDFIKADKLILPGVGAFDWAMESLNNSGLRDVLDDFVLNEYIPVLGICVGMQMMAKSSEEGSLEGLKWINAEVKKFNSNKINNNQIPHMGWNSIKPIKNNPIFKNIDQFQGFYFLHTYYVACNDSSLESSSCNYGLNFTSSLSIKNIHGVQFHPEKSHSNGIQLFKNFAGV